MHELKRKILAILEQNHMSTIVALARTEHQVLSQLVRFAYDKETLIGRRAIEAIGLVARDRMDTDYAVFREMIRKQLWSLSDESGGIGWAAPEIIGEIVSADTVRFQDVIPLIAEVYGVEEEVFRPGILFALYRIAQSDPLAAKPHLLLGLKGLRDRDPYARAYALMFLGALENTLVQDEQEWIKTEKNKLGKDNHEVWLYRNGTYHNYTIGELSHKTS